MTAYTWTCVYGTRTRVHQDAAREIRAVIAPVEGGWSWGVTQWGLPLDAGHTPKLADARTAAEQWLAVLKESTPA
jgi:hypothetical protein